MQPVRAVLPLVILAFTPIALQAQTVEEVFEGIVETENAGYQSIDNYVLKTDTLGLTTFEYFEKTSSLELDNGQTVYIMRNVMPDEIQERQAGESNALSQMSAEEMRLAATQIEEAGLKMEAGMMSEMQGAGIPGGIGDMLMNSPEDKPWLSPNPRDMTSMYATMLNASADAKDNRAAEDPVGDAQRHAQSMAAMQSQTRIIGRGEFNGVDAIEMAAFDLNYTQTEDGQQITWNTIKMQVDANRYVPLLFTMEGVVDDGNESRPITIEREDTDYRNVAGCGEMYRPFKSVMRMGGIMTPEQQAQMVEASAKMEEFETQMASMPASQRQMMEKMIGPQMEMMRSMASGGGIEIVSTVVELRCNTGLPNPIEIANTTFGGTFGVAAAPEAGTTGYAAPNNTDTDLLKMIQKDLKKLGFEPGNTDGVLDKLTVVAITKFQAGKGMEITGQPSPQLAGVLQAELAGAQAGASNDELTNDYLSGAWCTERTQERELYNFAADGSFRLGVVGLTITEAGGVNYFPETYSRQKFLDKFNSVASKDGERFSVMLKNGSRETFIRGNCFK